MKINAKDSCVLNLIILNNFCLSILHMKHIISSKYLSLFCIGKTFLLLIPFIFVHSSLMHVIQYDYKGVSKTQMSKLRPLENLVPLKLKPRKLAQLN